MAKRLTHHESHVLALIRKYEPTTAYFIRKAVIRSLASSFSDSPGSIYPIIARLQGRGLVVAVDGPDSGRKSELLSCTAQGVAAIKAWLLEIDTADLLPEDPWRTRLLLADQLSESERLRCLKTMRAAGDEELARIAERLHLAADTHEIDAAENAWLLTEARIAWLDRLMARMLANAPD